jgi:hypothetical protein
MTRLTPCRPCHQRHLDTDDPASSVSATHRLENPGKIPLHVIEVQSGSYLSEDGAWNSVRKRFRRLSQRGVFEALLAILGG